MRPLTLPVLGLLTLGASFSPLWAADPLAASLPANSTFFMNVSSLTKWQAAKSHPLVKQVIEGELGKALKPMLDKVSGEADEKTNAFLKEEVGMTADELRAKFPGGLAGGFSMSVAKNMEDSTVEPDMSLTLIADFTGDEALMQKLVNAADKMKEKSKAKDDKAEEEKPKTDKKAADKDADEDDEDEDGKDAEAEAKPKNNWPADYEEAVTEVEGAKVHEWTLRTGEKDPSDNFSWAVVSGKATLSFGKTDLKEVVARLAKPSTEGSLAATPAYKSLPDADRDSDLLMGVNLEGILGEIQEGLRVKMEKGEFNGSGVPINPLQAWTGAGLDQFRTAYISTSLEPDEIAMHWSLTYEEKPALLKIYAATGPGTPPAFVPNDVQDVGWGTMDWGQMFDNIKELAIAVSPMAAGGMEMGMGELKKKIGVDLRADILGQLGDDLWTVSYIDPDADDLKSKDKDADKSEATDPATAFQNAFSGMGLANQSQVIGIALKDSKAFELSLNSIFNTLAPGEGLFEDREFMGKTIHQFKGTPPNLQVAWLIHNDSMIFSIGKPALLDKILAGMDKKPANPLISETYVQAALAKLPPGGVSTSYSNAGQLIDTIFATFKPVLADEAEGEAAEVLKNLPDKLNLPWQFVSRMYLGDHAADVRIRLSIKP